MGQLVPSHIILISTRNYYSNTIFILLREVIDAVIVILCLSCPGISPPHPKNVSVGNSISSRRECVLAHFQRKVKILQFFEVMPRTFDRDDWKTVNFICNV
jgi:hypothetical protein